MRSAVSQPSIFTQIMLGKLPADIVYRDRQAIAFRDKFPKAPIHILIVPQVVIPNLSQIQSSDRPILGHLIWVASHVADLLGLSDSGYRLIINCNEDGGQEIQHLHLHLLGGEPLGPMRTESLSRMPGAINPSQA